MLGAKSAVFVFILGIFCKISLGSPIINAYLTSSFEAPPFVSVFLETVAAQKESLFFPLLDIISKKKQILSEFNSDNYHYLRNLVYDSKILTDNVSLSILDYELALQSSAPKVHTYYRYYNDTVISEMISRNFTLECKNWILVNERQYCSIDEFSKLGNIENEDTKSTKLLSFDHVFYNGKNNNPVLAVLYADLSSDDYAVYHSFLYEKAKLGNLKYIFRHKPGTFYSTPLYLSGYGVQASLKKTDYLVIDDRKIVEDVYEKTPLESYSSNRGSNSFLPDIQGDEIKSLTNTELKELGLSVAQFVMQSETPLETLNLVLQDFPKYASYLSTIKISKKNLKKMASNYKYLGPEKTMFFINGLQVDPYKINGFSLLKYLKKEHDLVSSLQKLGLTLKQAKSLITNGDVSNLFNTFLNTRFDFRDSYEGGKNIIWLNDIENDPNYMHFSNDIYHYFNDLPNEQLHMVRRNLHHVIIPLDFSKKIDLSMFKDIFLFIQNLLPIRFGIFPILKDPKDIPLIKIFYHLFNTYGIESAIEYMLYLEPNLRHNKTVLSRNYRYIVFKYDLDLNLKEINIDNIIRSEKIEQYILGAKKWSSRLNIENDDFLIVNGKFIKKNQNWGTLAFEIFMNDVNIIKEKIIKKSLTNDVNILDYLLEDSVYERNVYIYPSNKMIRSKKLIDYVYSDENLKFSSINENLNTELSFWLIADFDTKKGLEFMKSSLKYMIEYPYTSLRFLHNPKLNNENKFNNFSLFLFLLNERNINVTESILNYIETLLNNYNDFKEIKYPYFILDMYNSSEFLLNSIKAKLYWENMRNLLDKLEFSPGEFGLLANGYVIGPLPESCDFVFDDFKSLGNFYNISIISPLKTIFKKLKIKVPRYKTFFPVLSSIILSNIISEKHDSSYSSFSGRDKIYDLARKLTPSFTLGDQKKSIFEVKVILDPLNEISQKLVPILSVLEQIHGVYLEVYLNPLQEVSKLSINRFYRYVLNPSLKFDNNGNLIYPNAVFEGLPASHLYTIDYDFLESWIVTQKESIYDLDNLLLSDLSSRGVKKVRAIYELKYILIEGYAEEINSQNVPAGVQLFLKTKKDNFVTDTIIMNNFGYFQFKANPGIFKIDIVNNKDNDIFEISKIHDSFGSNNNKFSEEIILESFEGVTIFPKFIKNSKKEKNRILKESNDFNNNLEFNSIISDNILSQQIEEPIFNTSIRKSHAEINIFSIASGHLYERFLYIMILSVLKHTKHTVKIWFIENFLSSSFKNLLPYVADELGFEYELITYRWPHWLNSQKEKQRQIWAYKILFLDVLFPLDLNNIIFVDADQIVRTDLKELVDMDLKGAPYGYTPMCDSRKEMDDYSALYVVDLEKFRKIAAGDILRQHYQILSQDPESLSNLDQDLPNNLQNIIPIFSLPQNWLWCRTWCSDESLKDAKTIDLCNNPMTKESKLERARSQIPEWNEYDKTIEDLISRILKQRKNKTNESYTDNIAIPIDMIQNTQFNSDKKNKQNIRDEL
ncbi:hypothetical protein PORY_001827 [Pneumocystis oryctolagi]|uniref:Uncharacterized protein n=1 Tax=Pneumocystis oryctolagi TaxID=42067 RepID=A0ACB7CHK6_9ASCO|nr:hypothetical protein PORY_001827 [Pneumocystis oryctolagi]